MPRFKVGDKVTIRQWEDMEKEYWLDIGWYIPVPKLFTHTMKMYCWNTYTIKNARRDYYILDWIWYDFSDEMFEESKAPKYWIVKWNPWHPLHDKFIRYMNLKCWNVNKNYYTWDWEYYWFDWGSYNNWYVCVLCTDWFSNNPKLITLEEWDKWFGSEVEDITEVQSDRPKYWVVKRDKSNPLFQKCLNYLNETYGTAWTWNWESYDYYWFDWRPQYDNLESFENNPKLITLEEWDKWFGSEVSSEVKPEFKVWDRVYVKDTSVWCPWKFWVIVSISGITMSHCVKLDSWTEFFLNKEDLVKCEFDTTATQITGVWTTLTQETLQNAIDKLSGKSAPIPSTDTSYTEIYDSYKKHCSSWPAEAEEEPTSIFTFKKLK